MKKFIAFIFCLCALCTAGSAQSLETRTLSLGDNCYYEVIVPTLSNLIAIVNMDVSTFKSTMSRYKYHPDEQFPAVRTSTPIPTLTSTWMTTTDGE